MFGSRKTSLFGKSVTIRNSSQYPHSYVCRNLEVFDDMRAYVSKGATSDGQFLNIDYRARCRTANPPCWLDPDRLQLKLTGKLGRQQEA